MFLSKLVLNFRDRQARRDLAVPYELHRTLWRAFPEPDPGRVLFRVDAPRSGGSPVVLVQSDLRPQWERLCAVGPGYLLAPPEFKEFDPSFARGQRLRFRLRANPTKKVASLSRAERLAGVRVRDENSKNGRRLALLREEDQLTWLLRKGEQAGFRIPGEWAAGTEERPVANFRVQVIPEGWVRCGKDGHTGGSFYAVRFEGLLVVTDPEPFRATVAAGVGSGKGFGFGLLSLAPCGGKP
jgi:CRISPR system Cascade subunit CasE